MYEDLVKFTGELEALRRGHDPALFHVGGPRRLLNVHERHAALAANLPDAGVPPIGPLLMRRFADARTMFAAAQDLLAKGPTAAGPNGHKLQDVDTRGLWSLCRALAGSIRDGTYRPGSQRRVEIPKAGKPGQFRELTLRDVEDRVVGRGLVRILQPVLDPAFSPFAFGFRPRRSAAAALASALAFADRHSAWCWWEGDVEKAFDRVPLSQLLTACRSRLPEDVCAFIRLVADTGRRRGMRQGSPESPLLFNVFTDHFIIGPWHRRHPDTPLISYADNFLLACRSRPEALAAATELASMARCAGTPLAGSPEDGICDIAAGDSLRWLGYQIENQGPQVAVRIAEKAWSRLTEHMAEAHLHPSAPLRAARSVEGWLAYLGPTFADEDTNAVLARVRAMAAEQAFEEIGSDRRLMAIWHASHRRWQKVAAEQKSMLARLAGRASWLG
jgi:hypothetical protein